MIANTEITTEEMDALGRVLLEKMEHLDPSYPDEITWDGLSDLERSFYRHSALAVLYEAFALKLFGQTANDDTIG